MTGSEKFSAVARRLERTLAHCVAAPDVQAIHHARTGSRRLAAALDNLERKTDLGDAMQRSAAKLRKLLKIVRHSAGKARDIDVHRELLRKLASAEATGAVATSDADLRQEIAALDAKLGRQREKAAGKFQKRAAKWRDKLERKTGAVFNAAGETDHVSAEPTAAELALESFAGVCREIPVLDAGTLHDFRKGAKHARYIAEAGDDDQSRRTVKQLKRVQDGIGAWHDWLVLAAEARNEAEGQENRLVKLVAAKRDQAFKSAVKTTAGVREELLGEWETQLGGKKEAGRAEGAIRQVKSA